MAGETVSSQQQREESEIVEPRIGYLKRISYHAARSQESRWTNLFFLFAEGLVLSAYFVIATRLLGAYFQWVLDMPTIWFNTILYVSLFIFLQSFYTRQVRGTMDYCLHLASYPYVKKNKARLQRKSRANRLEEPTWFLRTRFNTIKRIVDRSTSNHFDDMLALALRKEDPEYSDADFNLIRSTMIIKLIRESLPLDDERCWEPFEENENKFIQCFQGRSTQPIELMNYLMACYKKVPDDIRDYADDGKHNIEERISHRREKRFQIMIALITVAIPSAVSIYLSLG